MPKSAMFFRLSSRLWLRFLPFALRRICRKTCPLSITDDEILGREIFSKRVIRKSDSRVRANAFLTPNEQTGISVSRLGLDLRDLLEALAKFHAIRRVPKRTFYGFGELPAGVLKGIRLTDGNKIPVRGTPSKENPFHADIMLAKDDGDDYRLEVADRLAQIARFVPISR